MKMRYPYEIDDLLPCLYEYIDGCIGEDKSQDYIDGLVDAYEFIEESFRRIDDNCTPCDTDTASCSRACDMMAELEGCDIPFKDVVSGSSVDSIYPDIVTWHDRYVKADKERRKDCEE